MQFQTNGVPADKVHRVAICNAHGAHDSAVIDSLTDVHNVCRCIPFQSTKVLCGDWNCDQLPSCDNDPFVAQPGRRSRHRQERQYFKALFERLGVCVALPQLWASNQHPIVRAHGDHIVTRMPSDLSQNPSLLDYFAANVTLADGVVDLTLWKSDHAAVKYVVQVPVRNHGIPVGPQ